MYIITDFQPFETTAAARIRRAGDAVRCAGPSLQSRPVQSGPLQSEASTALSIRASPIGPLPSGLSYPRHVNQGGMMMRHMLIAAAIAAGLVALWAALLPLAA